MNYYKWNNLIGDYLFNKEKDDIVFLYITKEQLVEEIYKKSNFSDDRDDQSIWSDFVDAVNNLANDKETYPHITFKFTNKSFGDRIRRLRDFSNEEEYPYTYPAYLAHLVLLIMGKANYTGDSDREIKKVIAKFFKSENIAFDKDEFSAGDKYFIKSICCQNPNAQRPIFDGGIWKELHDWSIKNGKGATYFNFVKERYVGMITDQCLISANVRERICELYSSAGLNKDGKYTLEDFRLHLLSKPNKLANCFNNQNATRLIREDMNLVKVLYRDFENWDGTYESDSNGNRTLTKTYNLHICCLVKQYENTFDIEYRINDNLPEEGIEAKYEDGEKIRIVEEVAGWSIPVKSSKIKVDGNGYHRTRIVPPEDNDFYFVTRKQEFGNKIVFVSDDYILENGLKVFFISRKDFGEDAKCFKDKKLTNSEGYKLYEYVVNEEDSLFEDGGLFYRYLNKDNVDTKKTLCFEGGLKIKGRGKQNEYLPRLLPIIVDYSFNNDLVLSDNSTNREYSLIKSNTDGLYDYNIWTIPEDVSPGTYNLKGTNKSITTLNPQDVLSGIVYVDHPCYNVNHPCYGKDGKVRDLKYFKENKQPFFQDNHFHTWERNQLNKTLIEDQYPKSYMCQVDYAGLSKSTTDVDFNFGDILIDWLYYQGECTRNDFVETYKFIQSQYNKDTNGIIFPTTTANSALKWLQKAGFVDYYDGKVYPCSPRLIALPVEKDCCNKFHLVGCRSLNLLHSVMEICDKHKNSFRFHAYQTTNGYLMSRLTPSSVFIECTGKCSDCFGCDLIVKYLCNDAIKILPPKPSHLYSFNTFSVGIDKLISRCDELKCADFSQRSKFYIFELDTLQVNKKHQYTIYELLDVLNGISLVQLFHNDYQYDNIIIDKDNNRLFRVPDEYESLGKMYVIKHNDLETFEKKCVRWCRNMRTGEVGLAVSKRIGLPRNLSLLMNYVSLFPPESLLIPELDKNHHYYYYIIKNGIRAEEIRAIIGKVLGLDLKQHTLEVAIDTVDMINHKLATSNQPSKQKHSNDNVIDNSALMLSNFFVSGDIPALYVHQERAVIDALSRWPVRVLFSDEVGLGKTFEVASTMIFLKRYCGVKRVIILTPKSVLKQWQDELREHFKLNVWRFDSVSNSYVDSYGVTKPISSPSPIGIGSPDIILMSAQYARGSGQNCSIFDIEGACLPDLLILDEAHSARESSDVSGNTRKTQVYSMLEKVSPKIPHIILATATPMQKEPEEYHSLLKLLGLSNRWQSNLTYSKSLDLIGSSESPILSDLIMANKMLLDVIDVMKPSTDRLNEEQNKTLSRLICLKGKDTTTIADYVRDNWPVIRQLLVLLHPAHLLTIRNTRRSLSEIGYKFPRRKLETISIPDSNEIEEFYHKVNDYLTEKCFYIENVLLPQRNVPIGFVRVGYQQRVASSLYACKMSLERRLEKIKELKRCLDKNTILENPTGLDDQELDELLEEGYDDNFDVNLSEVDKGALQRAIGIESTSITPLLRKVKSLLENHKDLKIKESIYQARKNIEEGDKVLVFSRYTDTVDALIKEFDCQGLNKDYKYGLYTGSKSSVFFDGNEQPCNKEDLKKALFSGDIRIVFCSDAASEGLNLHAAKVLINVDVPWTPSRLEQRIGRIERLGQLANEVVIYNVWYPNSIEARMYQRIQQRLENRNLALGEFPDVVAKKIRTAILNDKDDENVGENELRDIRNSTQVAALEELWSQSGNDTESELTRKRLMEICSKYFKLVDTELGGNVNVFEMQDGTRCKLTSMSGMDESVSLKSEIWNYFKYNDDSLNVVLNSNGRPVCYETEKDGKFFKVKHSSVPKTILKENLGEEDFLIEYPPMLPNSKNLDLSYAIDCEIEPAPTYWID